MKKKLSFILLVLFIALVQIPSIRVSASTITKELKVSSELTQWVLDQPTGTLYAISQTGRNLIFINSTTMAVEKSITFNGNPTDIIKDNGKLYIAIDNIHQIAVVDMNSRTITETLYTSSDPCRIVKDGDKIFYTTSDQWCGVYEYNLTSKSEQSLSLGYVYFPDIAINPSNHVLYIGESGSSGSNITYYSTIDKMVIGKSNYGDGYGFLFPSRNTIFDGKNVYYAGRDFNADDPRIFNGDFGGGESIIYVNNGLVYTTKSIYDKDTHAKLGDYGYSASLVEASSNTVYIYNKDNGSIKSFNDPNYTTNSGNVISLISGAPAAQVQSVTQSEKINSAMSTLEMRSKLIKWELDEPNNTLYGISKDDKALFFVNATTLNLEKSLIFSSGPTDIIQDQGKLYVALDDINQIAVIDTGSRTITGRLYTSSDPYEIVKDGNKIYYTQRDQWCSIYEYNLTTNADQKTSLGTVYNPDLAINTNDHILYVGESGSSGSNMYYYSTADNKVIAKSNYNGGYGFPYPGRNIVFDGEKVYYAGFGFDKLNPTRILGSYGEEIIFAKYGLAFSKTSIFDSESYTVLQGLGDGIDLYEVSEQGISYLYSNQEITILRIDPTKITSVQFNNQVGDEVDTAAYIDDLLEAPTVPTRTGYIFGGWYKEAECINPWNFSTDKVTGSMTLYAKWTESAESKAIGAFVTRLYQQCLSREPESGGLNYWKTQLLTKANAGADLANSFIFSPEFASRNVTDDEFLNIMYNTFFNRVGDSGGKAYWMDKLDNGISRLYVLGSFVNSTEFSNVCSSYGINRGNIQLSKPADLHPDVAAFVYRFYDKSLDRKPDDSGLNYWVNRLVTGQSTGADISKNFILSPEFTAKNLSDTDFITVMYRVFFNREPDNGGQTYWGSSLKAGKTRLDVLRSFVYSQEFAKICSNYGIKVGTIK